VGGALAVRRATLALGLVAFEGALVGVATAGTDVVAVALAGGLAAGALGLGLAGFVAFDDAVAAAGGAVAVVVAVTGAGAAVVAAGAGGLGAGVFAGGFAGAGVSELA
jgi:hypothetical protein